MHTLLTHVAGTQSLQIDIHYLHTNPTNAITSLTYISYCHICYITNTNTSLTLKNSQLLMTRKCY